MRKYNERLVHLYQERLLIRKALTQMAERASVSSTDAELLQLLEEQIKEANEVILTGVHWNAPDN